MYTLKRDKKSGIWHVYFVDRDGKRFRQTTKHEDKARARAVADDLYLRHADPTHSAADTTTVRAAADGLMIALVNEAKPESTREFYAQKLGHVLRLFGESLPMSRVDAKRVDGFIETRKLEGAKPSTIAKELVAIRRMLKHARRRGEFNKEISQVMPVTFSAQYEPRTRRIDYETAWSLIRVLPKDAGRYVAFTCATSSRDAGARRALGADYDRTRRRIVVRDLKTAASTREVPVVAITQAFADHAFDGLKPGSFVFGGTYSGALHALQRACKRLNIEPVTSNDLRRSLAHWLRAAGVPRDIASEFFAHVDERMMAKVYGKFDADELAARLDKILDESWKKSSDSAESAETTEHETPGKRGGSSGVGGAGGLCNPLPNHLATSPRTGEPTGNRFSSLHPSSNLDESWIDAHITRRIHELKAEAAAEEEHLLRWRSCIQLATVGTQEAEEQLRAHLVELVRSLGAR